MPKDNENLRLIVDGPLAPTEPQGYSASEMIRCDECLRANPPTRVSCLYCGSALPVTEASVSLRKPTLRPPEKHQIGYNTIVEPRDEPGMDQNKVADISNLLKLSPDDVTRIISAQTYAPLARTASREEAKLLVERLSGYGLRTIVIGDDELGLTETCVSRVRQMQFDDLRLTLQQTGSKDVVEVSWSDIVLIVSGRLHVKRVEVKERKSRKPENQIVDASQFLMDEAVVDFYTTNNSQTWRVGANGFDFSCLEDEKTLVANENIGRLLKLIISRAVQAQLDHSYGGLRRALDPVWGIEQENQSKGWRREVGRFSLGGTTVSSNENQFTRYSRLRYYVTKHNAVA